MLGHSSSSSQMSTCAGKFSSIVLVGLNANEIAAARESPEGKVIEMMSCATPRFVSDSDSGGERGRLTWNDSVLLSHRGVVELMRAGKGDVVEAKSDRRRAPRLTR